MRLRAYKYRIYPTDQQSVGIRRSCGCRRFIYNWGLDRKQTAFVNGQRLHLFSLMKELPALKTEFPWLGEDVPAQSLQVSLMDLETAFTRFFRHISKYPVKKKKSKCKDSFQVPQYFTVNPKTSVLTLPKLGSVRTVFDRIPEGKPKSVTVSMSKSGKFFASVLCEQDIDDPEPKPVDPKTTIGIDMGIKTFAVISDGRKFENPKFLNESLKKIKYLHRKIEFRRKRNGKALAPRVDSNKRRKNKHKLCLAYEKVANQRTDHHHKISSALTDESQVGTICIEGLFIEGMMANHCLARAIQDASWGEFFRQLEYKCRWKGINLVRIGRFDPSSKLCPCGFKNDALTLADRSWTCPRCGRVHDRDLLAAQNVKMFGLAKTAVGTTVSKLGELPGSKRERKARKGKNRETHPSLAGG